MSAPPSGILFYEARAKPLSTVGLIQPGSYYQFYLTGTLTLTNVYADGNLVTPLSQTPGTGGTTAASDGRLVPIYLNPTTIYRYQLYSATNQLLEDVDPYLPVGLPSQSQLGQIFYPQTQFELAAGITPTNFAYPAGNVLRYGADPTGVADSAAAFNQATGANFSPITYNPPTAPSPYRTAYVPAGRYLIKDTVYVPTGTIIHGDGMSTYIDASSFTNQAHNVFQMGWSLVSGVPTKDTIYLTGGYPPEIYGMFMNGGPASANNVYINFPGALCHDIWFSGAGSAWYLAGGYVYNCEVDIGLTGCNIGAGINQTVTNCRFFNQNTAISFDVSTADISDCIFNGCTIEYPKILGVGIGAGTVNIRGIKFVGCDFINNPASASFSAVVSVALTNCQLEFNSCTFHNWGGSSINASTYAFVVQAAGAIVDIKGCIFDGLPSNVAYTTSTTASVLALGPGSARITDCHIRNLPGTYGQGILLGGGGVATTLIVDGLTYTGTVQSSYPLTTITVGANAVVTANSAAPVNPFQVGSYLYFTGVTGMTQINGAEAVVTAIGGTVGAYTATTQLNTTGFGTVTGGSVLLSLPLVMITNTNTASQCYLNGIKGDGIQPLVNPQAQFPVRIKDATDWFGAVALFPGSSKNYVLLPYQPCSVYDITLIANLNQAGSGSYRKADSIRAEKNNDFTAGPVFTSFVSQATLLQSAANGNGVATMTVEFNQPGGGTNITSSNSGVLSVSWPSTYTFVSIDSQLLVVG